MVSYLLGGQDRGDACRKPDAHPRMERLEQPVVLVDSERLRDTRAQATIYKAMYQKVKEAARESGVSQVRLYVDKTNRPAQEVYRRLGMHESHYLMFEENA